MVDLRDLGWDEQWAAALAACPTPHLIPGRVALEDRQAFALVTAEGERPARVAGRLLQTRNPAAHLPKVGDWVACTHRPGDTRAVIQHILPRRTWLARKMPGRETAPQVLATNIDIVFVVQSLDATFNARRMERFLVMAHEGGARAVVVLNKADLVAPDDPRIAEARAAAGTTPVHVVSARTRRGMPEVRQHIAPGRTCVFAGTSGVGKSSLINRLYGEEIQATWEVRADDAKGRHTTTWREMILLPGGGIVIDTPGMREFHMWMADTGLDEAFPDLAELALRCHFRACSHTHETRCAVKAALAAGSVDPARFASFQKLRQELETLARSRREHTYLLGRRHARTLRGAAEDAARPATPSD